MGENVRNDIPPSGGVQSDQVVAAIQQLQQQVLKMQEQISSGEMSRSDVQAQVLRQKKRDKDALIEIVLSSVFVPDRRKCRSSSPDESIDLLEVRVGLVCFHREMNYRHVLSRFAKGVPVPGQSLRVCVGCGEEHLDALLLNNPNLAERCKAIICVGESKVSSDGSLLVPCTDSGETFYYTPEIVLCDSMWFFGMVKSQSHENSNSTPLEVINAPYELTNVPHSEGGPKTVVPPNENTAVACDGDTKKVIRKT